MSEPLKFKFEKVTLASGQSVSRPKIEVVLEGPKASLKVSALLDSGSDTTVVPKAIADFLGVEYDASKTTPLMGHHESCQACEAKLSMFFRTKRSSVRVLNVPILVVLTPQGGASDIEVVLGVA